MHRLGYWIALTQEWGWKINSNNMTSFHNTLDCFEIHQGRHKEFYVRCSKTGDDCTTEVDMYFNRNKLTKMAHRVEVVSDPRVPIDHFKLPNSNRLIHGSDATVQDGMGGFAWVALLGELWINKIVLLCYLSPTLPYAELVSKHIRHKANYLVCWHVYGIYHIFEISTLPDFKKRIKILVFTGSLSSISIAKTLFYLTSKSASDNDSDIKCEVRANYKSLKAAVKAIHIKSHQDDH